MIKQLFIDKSYGILSYLSLILFFVWVMLHINNMSVCKNSSKPCLPSAPPIPDSYDPRGIPEWLQSFHG